MRTIVIGDIHGCHAELRDLLDRVGPTADDRIVAIGDIVDRGPESENVLTFFRDHPNALSIMGNHERKHVRSARGEIEPALSQRIVEVQLGDRYAEWITFMEAFPTYVELPEAILVHGFFEPGVALADQRDTVIVGTLTGERHMETHHPTPWYDHCRPPKPLIVGHHDYLRTGEPLVREGRVYGIDTGCCTGGRLTALVLPGFEIVSVPSRADYWADQRTTYAALDTGGRLPLDLDWERLSVLAESHDRPRRPGPAADRAKLAFRVDGECRRLVPEIVVAVGALHGALIGELEREGDWAGCAEKKQAARFATAVGKHAAAPLLFAARRGVLDEAFVRRVCKTPRRLIGMAAALGVETEFEEEVAAGT